VGAFWVPRWEPPTRAVWKVFVLSAGAVGISLTVIVVAWLPPGAGRLTKPTLPPSTLSVKGVRLKFEGRILSPT
jgi:hypothetical protein